MENTMKFANGMNFKPRHPNAPETVRGGIYFKASDFKKFLDENVDDKGFVNTKMMKSKKDGSIYFILDDFKPKSQMPKEESEAYHNRYQHPDPSVQKANEGMNEKLFRTPLSEEDNKFLADMKF